MTQSKANCNPIPNTHYALPETVICIYIKSNDCNNAMSYARY